MAPYRSTPETPPERERAELAATRLLLRRVKSVSYVVIVGALLAMIGVGVLLYAPVRDAQYGLMGRHFPYLTAAVAFAPFGLCLARGPALARVVVRALLPRWRRELAQQFGLDEVALAETSALVER